MNIFLIIFQTVMLPNMLTVTAVLPQKEPMLPSLDNHGGPGPLKLWAKINPSSLKLLLSHVTTVKETNTKKWVAALGSLMWETWIWSWGCVFRRNGGVCGGIGSRKPWRCHQKPWMLNTELQNLMWAFWVGVVFSPGHLPAAYFCNGNAYSALYAADVTLWFYRDSQLKKHRLEWSMVTHF